MNLIFDFDGTICDSIPPSVDITNEICLEMGYGKVNIQELKRLGIKGLIKSRNIPLYKIPKIMSKYRKRIDTIYEYVQPFNGIGNVLEKLSKKHTLGILTSNKSEIVQDFLEKYNLNFFSFIYSEKDIFGKDKKLKKVLSKHNLKSNETYYVGDETRDIEAAKRLKLKTVAVTWGIESKQLLEKSNPDFIISKPEELLKIGF
jgi:HAD superfamily hydrolase (TIGR01549 family)